MTDRPIIMSADMVLAILAGRKTETRRLAWRDRRRRQRDGSDLVIRHGASAWQSARPGMRLWVKESLRAEELENGTDGVRYEADQAWHPIASTTAAAEAWVELFHYGFRTRGGRPAGRAGRWVAPIHPPRWASRLTLTLIEVRRERLSAIGEAGARAEGFASLDDFARGWSALHEPHNRWHHHPEVVVLRFSAESHGPKEPT